MRFDSDSRLRSRRRRGRLFLLLLLAAGLALAAAGAFRVGPPPRVTISPEPQLVGRSAPVEIRVAEPRRGLSRVTVEVVQGGETKHRGETTTSALPGWKLWGPRTTEWTFPLDLGKSAIGSLVEGEATLRVTATPAPAWLRAGTPVVVERAFRVRLTAPSLAVLSSQHYVAQGGAEAVVYRVGEGSVRDGVESGGRFFPGFDLPGGGAGERFALFAVPYDTADASDVAAVAADAAGNARRVTFVDRFFPRPPREDSIQLDDRFLAKVVPAILAGAPELADKGDLLENFLQINRDLRRANARALEGLAAKSRPEFLWKRPFLLFPGGQVMSSFADRRTYFYRGRQVDRQDHLGFDLASVQRADVPAANRGVVVLARELGIYGNAVVVDHGYGLMTLYAHLSRIAVSEGDAVERGQLLGASGETGLAGGDHLHFSFLLQGLPVTPIEWWDTHWLQDRLQRKLGPALPFGAAATP
jgi:murein DD-endopeptidase MepM/ murein hydrolase activator NlpD